MSTEDLRLDQLEAMSSDLRRKRSDLFEHVNRWRDERDRINESSRKMREEAQKHKEDRDKINARVAEIKDKLQPLYDKLDERKKKLDGLEKEIQAEYKELPRKRRVEKDLNRIEWEIMTTPTREFTERETEYVSRANELKRRLGTFKKPPKKTEATMEITAEAKATEMEIRHIRDEINVLREDSQKHHESMLTLFRGADAERDKANAAHGKFVEYLTEIKKVDEDLDKVMGQLRGMKDGFRKEEMRDDERRMVRFSAQREDLRQKALAKLAAGEKLTFDDLQYIYGPDKHRDEEEDDGSSIFDKLKKK